MIRSMKEFRQRYFPEAERQRRIKNDTPEKLGKRLEEEAIKTLRKLIREAQQ